mgnify:CR=1 FL=1
MTDQVYGVLLDTVSIQRYIFYSNNLKENIGGSFIVEDIYDSHLKEVIKELLHISDNGYYEAWKKEPERITVLEDSPFEIGYIGGGNALLFFKEKAREFISRWTTRLLVHCPGVVPACAISRIDFNDFSKSLRKLFSELARNKSNFVPETVIRRHGITAECPRTGYSAEVWCERLPEEEQNYISSVANAKIFASERADEKLNEILKECKLDSKFTFTNKLDELGQSKGQESHIAIVHIDGNDMGNRFREQKGLPELRKLSKSIKEATKNSFIIMMEAVIENIENLEEEGINLKRKDGKIVLPFRPIIIGGDDITFVSEGRLGIWLAKVFLEAFEKQTVSDNNPLSACAGVAITKTKYPFYRGYQLSEELTRSAKDRRKEENNRGSWIDFHLAYGGFSGRLEDIRKMHYKTPLLDSLVLRPYRIGDLDELLKGVAELKEKKNGKLKYPRSKIMKLREVLYSGQTELDLFKKELKARGLELPKYKDFNGSEIVKDKKTPYFDMIELMELYPEFALPGRER